MDEDQFEKEGLPEVGGLFGRIHKALFPTQEEFSQVLGRKPAAYRQWVSGIRTPRGEIMRKVANSLRARAGELLKLAEELDVAAAQSDKHWAERYDAQRLRRREKRRSVV